MKGITSASTTRWQVQIAHGGKQHYIGTYKTELEAALAYDAAARKHRPDWRRVVNFPDVSQIVSGFGGFPYKGYDPKDCPATTAWP